MRASDAMCRTSSIVTPMSLVSALEARLRDDERLAADLLVVEIDLDLGVAPRPGQFGDRARPEFAMPDARADHEHRRVLRFLLGRPTSVERHGRSRPARCGRRTRRGEI